MIDDGTEVAVCRSDDPIHAASSPFEAQSVDQAALSSKKRKRQAWKEQRKLHRPSLPTARFSPSTSPTPSFPLPLPFPLSSLTPSDFRSLHAQHRLLVQLSSESSYRLTQHTRHVLPYPFIHTSHARPRWIGRPLLSILCSEFLAYPAAHYAAAIASGRILVNGARTSAEHVLTASDTVTHRVHRHEPSVSRMSSGTVEERGRAVVVDKPAGMPVHPGGQFRHNSLQAVLMREHGLLVFSVSRLDRVTSGVLVYGRTPSEARRLAEGRARKLYVARVSGRFAGGEVGAETRCTAAIGCESARLSRFVVVKEGGKACDSRFTVIAYDEGSDTTLVQCQPVTGRTHQLRVHLSHLGHPIDNDARYGGRRLPQADQQTLSPPPLLDGDGTAEGEDGGHTVDSGEEESDGERRRRFVRDAYDATCAQCLDPSVYALGNTSSALAQAASPSSVSFTAGGSSVDAVDAEDTVDADEDEVVRGLQVDMICLHAWRYELSTEEVYEATWPAWAGGSEAQSAWQKKHAAERASV